MNPILLIDDDDDIREILSFALESEGLPVKTFPDANQALTYLTSLGREDYPPFIIVDYLMPGMTGADFIWTLKEKYPKTLGTIPMALSSALGEFDPKVKELKGLEVIPKPIDLEELLKLVKQHCL